MIEKFHHKFTPKTLRWVMNIYGPYLGAGIKVDHIAKDWKEIRISMKLRWYNKNIVGVHFGGSLYSMVDPHYMLMLMNLLGKDYIVWDKGATIYFVRPGSSTVYAEFAIDDDTITTIKETLEIKSKLLQEFKVRLFDDNNKTVARATKIVYIRKKD